MAESVETLLVETVDCLRDLLGALIDLQPPETQAEIAELQARLYEAVDRFTSAKSHYRT